MLLPPIPRAIRRRLSANSALDPAPPTRGGPPSEGTKDAEPAASLPRVVLPPAGVLIVDDDPFMLDMLPRRLKKVLPEGTRIQGASTPEEALRVVRENAGGRLVVLSDFDLRATMTGTELLRRVAEESPGSVRILFSGHTAQEVGPLDEAVVHGFVEKPFRLDELVPPLLRLIERAL